MSTHVPITYTLNGRRVARTVEARMHLIDHLQAEGLRGVHAGCEHGVCGACTIRLDGQIVRGCLVLAVQVDGMTVETIEGATASGDIRDLQDAFIAKNAAQCGFCTPAMLLTAAEFLAENKSPTREEIREAISGNYCRCTGFQAIVDAVESVAKVRAAKV
jgi:aerobic-type carbon monoxide dehydrogenase small subunit (CoxS/CutS family)